MDLTKFVIPMVCGDQRYQITIQVENPFADHWTWYAHGSDFENPMESPMGWGAKPEIAIYNFFQSYYPKGTPNSSNGC